MTTPTESSCCEPDAEPHTPSEALGQLTAEKISADVAAIRSAGFGLLLETGRPVTIDELTEAADVLPARVVEVFESVDDRGRVELDASGDLVGIAGLSLTPSRHQLTIGDTTRWTWCALDAVGILGALGATGRVVSTDPQTGDTITLEFVDGVPTTKAHLFILGGFTDGDVRKDWCPRVNFFSDRASAHQWVTQQGLDGEIVSVSDIAENAAAIWAPVVDNAAPQAR